MKPLNEQDLYIFLLCLINKNKSELILKKNSHLNFDNFLAILRFDKNRFFDWPVSNISYNENGKYQEDSSYLDFSKKHHEKTEILSITIDLNQNFITETSNRLKEYLKKFISNDITSKSIPLFKAHLNGFRNFLDLEKDLLNKNNISLSSDRFNLAILGQSRSRQQIYKPRFLDFLTALWFAEVIELIEIDHRTVKRGTINIYNSNFSLLKENQLTTNYFLNEFGIEHNYKNLAQVNISISAIQYNQSTKQLTINTEKGPEIFSFKEANNQRKTLETFFYLLNEEVEQPWSYELIIKTRIRIYKGECFRKNIKNDVDNIKKKIGKKRMSYITWSYKKDSGWIFSPH